MTYPCCGGVDCHKMSCFSKVRTLAGWPVTYTAVTRHVTTIDTDLREAIDNYGQTYTTAATRYRWRCSCGSPPGRWVTRRFQAEQGAKTHARRAR